LKTGLLQLGTIALAAALFLLLRDHAKTIALGLGAVALLTPILWLLVSSMRPALPDRTCPKCAKEALRLLEPGERVGARCPECGFEDAELYVPYLVDVDDDLADPPAQARRGEGS
jgi:hypothetical protein